MAWITISAPQVHSRLHCNATLSKRERHTLKERTDPFVFWMDKVEVVRFLPFLLAVRKIIVSLHAFTKKANKTIIIYSLKQ